MNTKVKFKGEPVELLGNTVQVGDIAPEITVTKANLSEIKVGGKKDKKQVLLIMPSVDTSVCDSQIKNIDNDISNYGDLHFFVISMDLPFAMARYGFGKDIKNLIGCSDFRNREFSRAYGVLVDRGPLKNLTCRATFVIDTQGKVSYKEICEEISNHPNYEALKKATLS